MRVDELIGKKAFKKRGLFSGAIGIIEKNETGITPYVLVIKSVANAAFRNVEELVIIEEETV